jgi:hypothetical protein
VTTVPAQAFLYAKKNVTTEFGCGWTRGTYMIGLWDYCPPPPPAPLVVSTVDRLCAVP